jgi:signal transduction histidine kinase
MREASRRVTFVNQVSHELKTPLTNIRMYAELLEKRLPDDDPRSRSYIEILVAETGRLSRLISNVLTFAKQRRDKLKLHLQPAVVDDVIKSVAASFAPALDALNIRVEHTGSAGRSVALDVDKLEQILGNLINNVEKYAADAATLRIERRQDEASTTIIVADDGSGIPQEQRDRIFRPFERLSNRLTDGVSGTGIGLSIARQLARLHGGDLILLPANGSGAAFQITLNTPEANR